MKDRITGLLAFHLLPLTLTVTTITTLVLKPQNLAAQIVDSTQLKAARMVPVATPNSALSFLPYFYDDFESGKDGTALKIPYDAAGRSHFSREQAHSGQQAARMEIRAGDKGGFGQWGAVLPLQPALTKGQEVWVRLYVYWPRSFQFTASPWMKFLRFHTRAANGENHGYNDLYVDRADQNKSVLRTIKEQHDKWAVYDGESLPRDQWECYEMYLFLDNVPAKDGGQGRVRIWREGKLIFDRNDVPTLSAASDTVDSFYLFTYWNNENPPDNYCFVDDLAIATSANPPLQRDEAGHTMIGTWLKK